MWFAAHLQRRHYYAVKAEEQQPRPAALAVGDMAYIFSHSANEWVRGRATEMCGQVTASRPEVKLGAFLFAYRLNKSGPTLATMPVMSDD